MEKKLGITSILIAAVIVFATGIFIFLLMQGTKKEAEVLIEGDHVRITGQYGITFALGDIEDVRLSTTIPAIGAKTNGAGLGDIKKGDYILDGIGKCRLFLHNRNGPYLFINLKDGKIIIMSYADGEKTEGIYQMLKSAMGL